METLQIQMTQMCMLSVVLYYSTCLRVSAALLTEFRLQTRMPSKHLMALDLAPSIPLAAVFANSCDVNDHRWLASHLHKSLLILVTCSLSCTCLRMHGLLAEAHAQESLQL